MRHSFVKLLTVLALLSIPLLAQGTPDCQWSGVLTAAGNGDTIQNRPTTQGGQAGCVSFRLVYWTNAASATSIELDGSPDTVSGSTHAPSGSWSALTPAPGGGSGSTPSTNPATTSTNGQINLCCDYYPWLRVKVNTLTSSGSGTQVQWRVYGYKGTTAGTGSGGGSGTIAHTTNALKGDGSGNAIAVTGTSTNCVLVDGTSAACSSTTGNAASIVTYTPGSTVTLTCPSSSAGTVTVFAPSGGAALSANMAITFASCTTGQDVRLAVKQAASGGPYTLSGMPSGSPQPSPVASVSTTYVMHATAASTMAFDGVQADGGPGVITLTSAPSSPPPVGYLFCWGDSTALAFTCENASGAVFTMADWTDDGTNITARAGRNVVVGNTLPTVIQNGGKVGIGAAPGVTAEGPLYLYGSGTGAGAGIALASPNATACNKIYWQGSYVSVGGTFELINSFNGICGTVNVSGTAVTFSTGTNFANAVAGEVFYLNSGSGWTPYTIASKTDSTHLVLTASAGSLTGASFSTIANGTVQTRCAVNSNGSSVDTGFWLECSGGFLAPNNVSYAARDASGNIRNVASLDASANLILADALINSVVVKSYGGITAWQWDQNRNFLPGANDSYDVGAPATMVRNVYVKEGTVYGVTHFANLYAGFGNGAFTFCDDCKNSVDDGATVGAACAGSGHGAFAARVNGSYRCY